MADKVESYIKMSRFIAANSTQTYENWTDFLKFASRFYKYSYNDQVLIYYQRPQATAVASYEIWNQQMRRYVKRGTKGIAVLNTAVSPTQINYLFDIADTGTRRTSRNPNIWKLLPEHEPIIQKAFEQQHDLPNDIGALENQLELLAMQYVSEYWEANKKWICDNIADSYLSVYDSDALRSSFGRAATNSALYQLINRCFGNPDDFMGREDFEDVRDWNSPEAAATLGTAVNVVSGEILREIEIIVRNYDRNKERSQSNDERTDLHADRGLSVPEHQAGHEGTHPADQIRVDAENIPSGEQSDPVQHPDDEPEAVRSSSGSAADGRTENRADHERTADTEPRAEQGAGSDGLGTAHEQLESTGGGDRDEGAYLQLGFLIPQESQQIEAIEHGEAESVKPSAFSIDEIEIDRALRNGSGYSGGKIRIAAAYDTIGGSKERADFLKKEYGIGGRSWDFTDGSRGFVDYDGKGIVIKSWEHKLTVKLKWNEVEKRIGKLVDTDQYLSTPEKERFTALKEEFAGQGGIPTPHPAFAYPPKPVEEFHSDNPSVDAMLNFASQVGAENDYAEPQRFTMVDTADGSIQIRDNINDGIYTEPDGTQRVFDDEESADQYMQEISENAQRQASDDWLAIERAKLPPQALLSDADFAQQYLIPGETQLEMEGRQFLIDRVNLGSNTVNMQDISFVQNVGFPIFRTEPISYVRRFVEIDEPVVEHESPSFSTEVVAEYPAEENKLPYDIVVETLHIEEPQQSKSYIDHYYVVNDLDNPETEISEYETLDAALTAYQQIPADRLKAFGAQNTNRLPGSLDFIQCVYDADLHRHRDVLITDYLRVPGWDNSEVYDIVHSVEQYLDKEEQITIPAQNFHITDFNLGVGGAKAKFRMNMDAINLLQELEFENRNATPAEQEILSKYVGWGGLADAFDENKAAWSSEFKELYAALSPEEYAAARASTLNAHYTSPTVIQGIYDGLVKLGFENGNILEPSMGVGNFFGMLPESMQASRLYGVELDSITGRIAQKLYPNAEIKVAGFETTDRRDFYDVAVGNVPFGNYKVADKPYDKLGFSIHNYFFAKSLDQVRPGGIIAFVTSRFTMDAKNPDARKYIAQRAELLGAIRLPNNAFRANAGTDVVSDILFLKKREHPIDIDPDWVHLGQTSDGYAINSYFIDHPEMVLGTLTLESTQYGKEDCTVEPIEGLNLSDQLAEAVSHLDGYYQAAELMAEDDTPVTNVIPADPTVKNYSFTVVDGDIYFRENSLMRKIDVNATAQGRIKGMIALRDIVNELIEYQVEDYPDEDIASKQRELNAAYDSFTARYGLINDSANSRVFSAESSYYLLCSLENLDEERKLKSKADMFTKRTIRPYRKVTSVDTPSEALAVSIGERGCVDLPFMAELLGKPGEFEAITTELRGVIFKDPMSTGDYATGWQTADEYLSGNVREKLRIAELAAKNDPELTINVEALQKAQPKDLDATEIDVRLGATWIDRDYIQRFMLETFETPFYLSRVIQVKYSEITAEWQINGKSNPSRNDVAAYVTYGTERANAYRILEDTLNLKDIRIYDQIEDADGKQKRVLNKKETTLAQQKQQAIKDAFRDWIWKDPHRREVLVKKYNELFNSTRPREFDGSHIRFAGMNPDITLREHQRNAIAHVLYGGNTLLAHEVGAGKTFEMAASAMEAKRLGLCQKSLFVVPNHLTMQWASDFLRLYPSAKLLVATPKDFEPARRKKFCARIATGDYDAIIIGHSQFEKIPISPERQERQLNDQIYEITAAIDEMKYSRGEQFSIKQMEKTKKSLEARLEKLNNSDRKDDVIYFEQLGVDRLFVDESHAFKNLFLYTKMRNVAGLSTSEAQKSSDMFMKCRYMDELTGGRGVVFATGTPVSNSMTELYTVMRYLQYSTLQQKRLTHFDCWASTFGETSTAIELAPEGTGYRARTRFAKFFNLPELMNMFKEVADIKTSDQLHLPVPEAKFETVVVEPSEIQQEMVKQLSERAAAVHNGNVDSSVDNMLCITSDGRKIGLDQRLMNPDLMDDPNSKLNACVGNVFRIWEENKEAKLTQLLFCDMSTPKGDGKFNVYDDIRAKLVERGVPTEEIAFIHDADTQAKKDELFRKVRTGQVRVLLGSTQKMGAGTNVQDLLIAVHHLDIGWRPADLTQRNGRIIRQGNQNKQVQVYNYVTNGTFDAYLWQTLENKQRFISQIMTSKSPVRSCEDVDEQALSYAEIKALCAGNPLIKEKMDLDIEVARLKVLKADHQSQQFRLEDKLLKYFPEEIKMNQQFIDSFQKDIAVVEGHPLVQDGFCGIEIHGKHYTEKEDAGKALMAAVNLVQSVEPVVVGSYRGFQIELFFDSFFNQINMNLRGDVRHKVSLGGDGRGNLLRMDHVLADIPERLKKVELQLVNLQNQQEAARAELGKPFPQAQELSEKSTRLAELDAALNMDESSSITHDADQPDNGEHPSILENLQRKRDGVQRAQPKEHSRNVEER